MWRLNNTTVIPFYKVIDFRRSLEKAIGNLGRGASIIVSLHGNFLRSYIQEAK
jgi:hypothetical protein